MEAESIEERPEIGSIRITRYLAKLKKLDRGRKASEIRSEIQSTASHYASVVRTEEDLRKALEKAFDYRGDVTLTLKSGDRIEVFLFNRHTGPTRFRSGPRRSLGQRPRVVRSIDARRLSR